MEGESVERDSWSLGVFRGDMEIKSSSSLLESMKVILMKTSSNGEY